MNPLTNDQLFYFRRTASSVYYKGIYGHWRSNKRIGELGKLVFWPQQTLQLPSPAPYTIIIDIIEEYLDE